jgi:hypothetical protein
MDGRKVCNNYSDKVVLHICNVVGHVEKFLVCLRVIRMCGTIDYIYII